MPVWPKRPSFERSQLGWWSNLRLIFPIFFIWPSVSILINSLFTPASKWRGTFLPLACTSLNGDWNCVTLISLRIFPTLVNNSLNSLKILSFKEGKFLYLLSSGGWLIMQIGWGHFLWVTSMPILGRLSFPRIFCSWPPVMRNGVSSLIHRLFYDLTIIFPKTLIVSSVKPQYKSLILFSTG